MPLSFSFPNSIQYILNNQKRKRNPAGEKIKDGRRQESPRKRTFRSYTEYTEQRDHKAGRGRDEKEIHIVHVFSGGN